MPLVCFRILSLDDVCLYSECELSKSLLNRSMEYVPGSMSFSCPPCGGDQDLMAGDISSWGTFEVLCDSTMVLELHESDQPQATRWKLVWTSETEEGFIGTNLLDDPLVAPVDD